MAAVSSTMLFVSNVFDEFSVKLEVKTGCKRKSHHIIMVEVKE